MFNGYEWQGFKLEVTEARPLDKLGKETIRRDVPTLNHRPLPDLLFKPEPVLNTYPPAITPPVSAIPTPISIVDPPYQNVYRYGGPETAPPPPHLPPPLPMYTHMSLVGGPAANLPTHGHNQIFVNNVRIYIKKK